MSENPISNKLSALASMVEDAAGPIRFNILEVGALPLGESREPFHQLLELFPGSKISAFEVDEKLCSELNKNARPGMKYYPYALGQREEERTFYETVHPMCSSLYRPNEELISKYQNLDVSLLKSESDIKTVSLDRFIEDNQIGDVDFIKIDIQGAELEVFRGGVRTLEKVVAIVSEVIFVPLYLNQPLFGDVCTELASQDFMFHKFLGVCGRTLKPMVMNNNRNHPSQHMWSDPVYIKDILSLQKLPAEKLVKMGVLAFLYGSPDVAYYCFRQYDAKESANLCHRYSTI